MIYTITLNPALDYFMDYSAQGKISTWAKTDKTKINYGGKGINASALLNHVGVKNETILLAGGNTGQMLENLLREHFFNYKMFDTKADTRINVKAQFDDTYELGTNSVNLNRGVEKELKTYLERKLVTGDVVMIMGSTMDGLPKTILDDLSKLIKDSKAEVIYDISGKEMLEVVKYRPLVIKPNVRELEEIFDVEIKDVAGIKQYATKLLELGAQNVIISHDDKGAYLFNDEVSIKTEPLKIKMHNGSGAGDSMIAGFLAKFLKTKNYETSLNYANACGAGTASVETIAEKQMIEDLFKKTSAKEI